MADIKEATTAEQFEQVRQLFSEYWSWLNFEPCFRGFEKELAGLPGRYAAPSGCLLIAYVGAAPAGCVGLRPFSEGICEMKRLFVRPTFQGRRIGYELATRVVAEARKRSYRRMRLDTLPVMTKALSLYVRLGFKEIGVYQEDPVPGARFMELEL
jgi:putative acetyltransferase